MKRTDSHPVTRSICILLLLLLTAIASGCGLAAYTTQATETSGVTTPAGPLNVTVANFDGPIIVIAGPDGRVEAELTRSSRNDDQAEAEAIDMTISQSGPDVRIDVTYTGTNPHSAEAGLAITVPEGSSLNLRTATGEISASDPFGDVTAQIDSGDITLGAFKDESFSLSVQGTGELQSDFETIPSQPLAGSFERQVGETPSRALTAIIGQGKVSLQQMSAP